MKNNVKLFDEFGRSSTSCYEAAELALSTVLPNTRLSLRPAASQFYRGDEY